MGALRREAAAEARCQALQAELAGVHQLACGREQELQQNAMVLKLRAGQIERLQVWPGAFCEDGYVSVGLPCGPVLLQCMCWALLHSQMRWLVLIQVGKQLPPQCLLWFPCPQ